MKKPKIVSEEDFREAYETYVNGNKKDFVKSINDWIREGFDMVSILTHMDNVCREYRAKPMRLLIYYFTMKDNV